MNLVLFEEQELSTPLNFNDPRGKHIRKVLRLEVGDSFRSGLVGGMQGQSTITEISDRNYILKHEHLKQNPPHHPIALVCGTPRPNSAKRILRDGSTMGLEAINFVHTELGEKSYRDSHIWKEEVVRDLLKQGASQSYSSSLPNFNHIETMKQAMDSFEGQQIVYFDNVEDALPASEMNLSNQTTVCFIGSERGWSTNERAEFKARGFKPFKLGTRVMRSDTAFISALTLIQLNLGLLD